MFTFFAFLDPRIQKLAAAFGLTLLAAGPVMIALEAIPALQGRDARAATAAMERGLALLSLIGAALWAWRTGRNEPLRPLTNSARLPDRHALHWALLPLLPAVAYVILLTVRAFRGLFLVDKDYAGISAALDNTVRGWGILATPYFESGATASYLGHHFSPGLLLFTPFYAVGGRLAEIAPQATLAHEIYGLCLAATFAAGLVVWGFVFAESVGGQSRIFLVLVLAFAYPLFRLAQSFHYETPVLLFSGMAVLGLRRGHKLLFWVGVVGWSLWKEDLGAYVALFGGVLFFARETRRLGVAVGLFGTIAFVLANFVFRPALSGPDGPQWNYLAGLSERSPEFGPLVALIFSFGGICLFAPRVLIVGLLPIAALHAWSGHPWHQTYYGHYSYSILPFLLWGTAEGAANLEWRLGRRFTAALLLALAAVLYAAGAEKEAPIVPPGADPRQPLVRSMLSQLSRGACVQLEARMTAQAPLGVFTVPFFPPAHNLLSQQFPNLRHPETIRMDSLPAGCLEYYVLLDQSRGAMYAGDAEHEVISRELLRSSQVVETRGPLALLRVRAAREMWKDTNAPPLRRPPVPAID